METFMPSNNHHDGLNKTIGLRRLFSVGRRFLNPFRLHPASHFQSALHRHIPNTFLI